MHRTRYTVSGRTMILPPETHLPPYPSVPMTGRALRIPPYASRCIRVWWAGAGAGMEWKHQHTVSRGGPGRRVGTKEGNSAEQKGEKSFSCSRGEEWERKVMTRRNPLSVPLCAVCAVCSDWLPDLFTIYSRHIPTLNHQQRRRCSLPLGFFYISSTG